MIPRIKPAVPRPFSFSYFVALNPCITAAIPKRLQQNKPITPNIRDCIPSPLGFSIIEIGDC